MPTQSSGSSRVRRQRRTSFVPSTRLAATKAAWPISWSASIPGASSPPGADLSPNAGLEAHRLRERLAVVRCVAEEQLARLRAFEVEVRSGLVREAHAAVDLDAVRRGVEVGLGAVRLRERRRLDEVRLAGCRAEQRVVGRR